MTIKPMTTKLRGWSPHFNLLQCISRALSKHRNSVKPLFSPGPCPWNRAFAVFADCGEGPNHIHLDAQIILRALHAHSPCAADPLQCPTDDDIQPFGPALHQTLLLWSTKYSEWCMRRTELQQTRSGQGRLKELAFRSLTTVTGTCERGPCSGSAYMRSGQRLPATSSTSPQ